MEPYCIVCMYIGIKIVFWSDFLNACVCGVSLASGRTRSSPKVREKNTLLANKRNIFQLPVCQTPAVRSQQQTNHKYEKQR